MISSTSSFPEILRRNPPICAQCRRPVEEVQWYEDHVGSGEAMKKTRHGGFLIKNVEGKLYDTGISDERTVYWSQYQRDAYRYDRRSAILRRQWMIRSGVYGTRQVVLRVSS